MKPVIAALPLLLSLSGCAGSVVGDAIAGPEKLAEQDDAYCRSIGATGRDYTNCRLMVTQQRDARHAHRLGLAAGRPGIQCTTVGPTTTCN